MSKFNCIGETSIWSVESCPVNSMGFTNSILVQTFGPFKSWLDISWYNDANLDGITSSSKLYP